jgi:hypothetical protein
VVLGQCLHQVGEPIGYGVEPVLNRLVGPLLGVLQGATSRNVTIAVTVLMISCQVSTSGGRTNDGAHTSTSSTQSTKNHARDTKGLTRVAERSNTDKPVGRSTASSHCRPPALGVGRDRS